MFDKNRNKSQYGIDQIECNLNWKKKMESWSLSDAFWSRLAIGWLIMSLAYSSICPSITPKHTFAACKLAQFWTNFAFWNTNFSYFSSFFSSFRFLSCCHRSRVCLLFWHRITFSDLLSFCASANSPWSTPLCKIDVTIIFCEQFSPERTSQMMSCLGPKHAILNITQRLHILWVKLPPGCSNEGPVILLPAFSRKKEESFGQRQTSKKKASNTKLQTLKRQKVPEKIKLRTWADIMEQTSVADEADGATQKVMPSINQI